MKSFAFAALVAAVQAAEMTQLDFDFMRYVVDHQKTYNTVEEFNFRKELFARAEAEISEMNAQNGGHTSGHNMFSDMTKLEKNAYLGLKDMDLLQENHDACTFTTVDASVDWRNVGDVVSPVKDQGGCGSCWAFSTIEVLESFYVISGNSQVIMAPQELVDCSKGILSNHGCNGGMYYNAYNWLRDNKSMKESDYPYTSGATGKETACAYDAAKGVTNVSHYCRSDANSTDIKAAITHAPVNVALAAGNSVFMYYTGGVIRADAGCPTQIDHAVVAVGYGSENGVDYYIVRNSWNTSWGENGFVRLEVAEGDGTCGMNNYIYSITDL